MTKINITAILLLVTCSLMQAQVAIGKQETTNTSVSLEFTDTENKGLILPYVETKTGITEEGTLIYDVTDHKVKYKNGASTWANLSEDDGTTATIGVVDISIQTTKDEKASAKTVIGADGATNSTPGILVLSDTNKAMILPKVASPHLNIYNPAPGMMVYDTTAKQLAVYNGKVWSFWKP
ncbi:hypothetical protein GSF70_12780 [Flavobacteriaceae bacterium W22]|nr:hypothetical protein [Flavobacteriaceae bacterium W22]